MCLLWVKFRRFWWSENTSAYPPTADFENEFSEFSEITSAFRRAADINSPVLKGLKGAKSRNSGRLIITVRHVYFRFNIDREKRSI